METSEQYYETINVLRTRIIELEHLAYIDPLTGLYNRRAFDERLMQVLSRAKRSSGTVSLAILDLDNFKAINDSHGHVRGDECLKKLAGVLRSIARTEDVIARVGGEEFAVILAGITELNAVAVVERMAVGLRCVGLTFSAGVASVEAGGFFTTEREAASLYERADAAMYEVKRNGKDRVSSSLLAMTK